MDSIFHEKQEGSLCAQHCLNVLLQGQYFSAVDLADIGKQLDALEREKMAEQGVLNPEYQRFLEQPSGNFDDSGYFSIQVIEKALENWGLALQRITAQTEEAKAANDNPVDQKAFICNFENHWLCIRKLGKQWFDLNSLHDGPNLISDTHLSLYLAQLKQQGYSIHVVLGDLPPCEADEILTLIPAVQEKKHKATTSNYPDTSDAEVQRAMADSRRFADQQDESLQRALALSMLDHSPNDSGAETSTSIATTSQPKQSTSTAAASATNIVDAVDNVESTAPSSEEVRQNRAAFLSRMQPQATSSSESNAPGALVSELTEDEQLELAIQMSKGT